MRNDGIGQNRALERISTVVTAQGIAIAVFVLLFARPELAENAYYVVAMLSYAAVSTFVGLVILRYARKHSSVAAARRALTTAEPLPKPPFSERTLIVVLFLFGCLGIAGIVAAILAFNILSR